MYSDLQNCLQLFSHENEVNGACVEKVKSAYQLMGFMFDMENTKKIRKASVWYKKRFNQIRFQNRILRLHKPLPNRHIYFDDDGEAVSDTPPQVIQLLGTQRTGLILIIYVV